MALMPHRIHLFTILTLVFGLTIATQYSLFTPIAQAQTVSHPDEESINIITPDARIQYTAEITAIEKSLKNPDLSFDKKTALNQSLAKLHIMNGAYEDGAELMEYWIGDWQTAPLQNIEQIIAGWFLAKNYQRALPWAERLFQRATPKQRKHYDLINKVYVETQQLEKISPYPAELKKRVSSN